MKKSLFIIMLLIQFSIFASNNSENWLSFCSEYGYMLEKQYASSTQINTSINSVGLNVNSIYFKNGKDTGFFASDSFNILLNEKITTEATSQRLSFSDAYLKSYISLLFGKAYRNIIDNEKTLYYGFGPSLQEITYIFPSGDDFFELLLGVGSIIGLKLIISEKTYWDIGIVNNASLFNYNMSNLNPSGSFNSVINFTIKPHIGIGFVN